MNKLTERALALGVRFQFDARVCNLVVEDSGRVVGVRGPHLWEWLLGSRTLTSRPLQMKVSSGGWAAVVVWRAGRGEHISQVMFASAGKLAPPAHRARDMPIGAG